MKAAYTKAEDVINKAQMELDRILETAAGGNQTIEDQEAYSTLENIIDRLERAENYLKYLNKPVKNGVLQLDTDTGKYFISFDDGEEGYLLSCGHTLEVYIDDEWIIGRVEARGDGEYYFYGADRPALYRGMRVRKRFEY